MERIDRLFERMDQLTCAVERKPDSSQQLLKDIHSRNGRSDQPYGENQAMAEQVAHRQHLSAKHSELLTSATGRSPWSVRP